MSNENINKLSEIRSKIDSIYQDLEDFRDCLDNQIKEPINLSRGLINDIQALLSIQHDLLVFKDRNDNISLQKSLNKLKKR